MPVADWFTQAFGELIADMRQKVVEEPWFGRAVTPASMAEPSVQSLAEALGWARSAPEPGQIFNEPDGPEHGIER